ncbi:MAG TPA: hypothetical protein VGH89_29470 [Pseudonocardia sp.]
MRADLDHLLFQVTPDNILHIHHTLAAEATLIRVEVWRAESGATVGIAAKDPVSRPAAEGFNRKIERLLRQCADYGRALQETADQLKQMATNYGHTEAEIERSFSAFNGDYQRRHSDRNEPGS